MTIAVPPSRSVTSAVVRASISWDTASVTESSSYTPVDVVRDWRKEERAARDAHKKESNVCTVEELM